MVGESDGHSGWFLPVLVALLSVLSPAWLFTVCLLAFHLGATNAPGEAEADIAAGEGALAGGRVVWVDALATSADGIEEVIDVEEQRQTTLEQVSAHAPVNGELGGAIRRIASGKTCML